MADSDSEDRRLAELMAELGPDAGVELSEELTRRWSPERLSKMVAARAGSAQRLDILTRQKYETRFGVDLSRVRLVTGPFAEEFTAKHNAEALTIGNTGMVVMSPSERFSGGAAFESLLAHELTHVAQAQPGFHKKVTEGSLGSSSSEAEAEAHEAQVLDEQQGGPGTGHDGEDSDTTAADAKRHEDLVSLVWKMFEDEQRHKSDRFGGR